MTPQKRRQAASPSSVDRRAAELDTMAAVLPIDRRDELAELLTDQGVETLRHLVNEGMGENTLRALTSDLAYLQARSLAATGASLPWPAPEAMLRNLSLITCGIQTSATWIPITACPFRSSKTSMPNAS